MPMNFGEAWLSYFNDISDLTWFFQLFFYCAILIVLDLPRKLEVKPILLSLAKLAGLMAFSYFFCGLFYALERAYFRTAGIIFSSSMLFVAFAYVFIFLKDGWLKKFIKFSFIAAGIMVTSQVGRNLGLVFGALFNDNFVLVALGRSLPSLVCVLLGYIMWRYDIKNIENLPKSVVVLVLVLSYFLISLAIWENQVTSSYNQTDIYVLVIFIYVFLLAILILGYYSLFYMDRSKSKLVESEIRYNLSEAENEAIKLNETKIEEFRKFRHDLKNQLSYLSILLDEGKIDEAKGYLATLNSISSEVADVFVCSNKTISSIINLELAKAKAESIRINANVVVPPVLPFEDLDLVSLISNLLDNAIENYDHDSSKGIVISIFNYQDYLRISVSNPIKKTSLEKAKKLETSKEGIHGYGTKIIRSVASQYNGHASFAVEDDDFIADVVLSLNNHSGDRP